MGKALSGELSCPCDRSWYLYDFYFAIIQYGIIAELLNTCPSNSPIDSFCLIFSSSDLDKILLDSTTLAKIRHVTVKQFTEGQINFPIYEYGKIPL